MLLLQPSMYYVYLYIMVYVNRLVVFYCGFCAQGNIILFAAVAGLLNFICFVLTYLHFCDKVEIRFTFSVVETGD